MRTIHAVAVAAALVLTVTACTEDVEPLDDSTEATARADDGTTLDEPEADVLTGKQAATTTPVASDTIEPTSCSVSKVLVCHVPPGNPANAHAICISPSAVEAHLALHGDSVGACANRVGAATEPVCRSLTEDCTTDAQCCSQACVWGECIDHI